jgi:integrase
MTGWLRFLRLQGLSPSTIRLRRDHLRMIARRSGTAGPGELTRDGLQALASEARWSLEHRKGIRSSLHSFYLWCAGQGLVEDDMSAALPKVRAACPAPRPAPDRVWGELLAAAGPRERLMALLAGEAGLRRAEVAAVHTDDVFADGAGWSLVVHGKGGRQRIVPLSARLAAELADRRCSAGAAGGFVFPGNTGGHLSAHYVGELMSDLMPAGWSMHTLRHRFATRGYAGTHNLRAVQEALGHASVATTQRYTAVAGRDLRAVSDAAAAS